MKEMLNHLCISYVKSFEINILIQMSNANEENDLMKSCSRCGIISLKTNFHKKKLKMMD